MMHHLNSPKQKSISLTAPAMRCNIKLAIVVLDGVWSPENQGLSTPVKFKLWSCPLEWVGAA